MSTLPTPVLLGTSGSPTNPALEIGNDDQAVAPGWTHVVTSSSLETAGIGGVVLAIGSQPSTGTLLASLVSADEAGNLGIAGSVSLSGAGYATAQSPTIGAADGTPPDDPGTVPSGSLYLRADEDPLLGARFFQYTPQPQAPSGGGAWLDIPAGLGVINVKDYGAVGNNSADDGPAFQLALYAAENSQTGDGLKGGLLYVPPGEYLTSGALLITGSSNLTICGAGPASLLAARSGFDTDLLYASGFSGTLTLRNLNLQGAASPGSLEAAATSGATLRFDGPGKFLVDNVNTTDGGFGIYATNGEGSLEIVNSTIKGDTAGAYIASQVQMHHSHLNGTTYGLICDGCSTVEMTNVALFGALSITAWNTNNGGSGSNGLSCYDVEANYGDIMPNKGAALTTGSAFDLSGAGSNYPIAVNETLTTPFPTSIYVRDDAHPPNALSGVIDTVSGSLVTVTSTFEAFGTGTISPGASAWFNPPYYPSQLGGEGEGSASLVANSAQVHLTDCWFQGSTVVGGAFPGSFTITTDGFTYEALPYEAVFTVADSSKLEVGSELFIADATHRISGSVAVLAGDTVTLALSGAIPNGPSTVASGAFVSLPFSMVGKNYFPLPPEPANAYPFAPNDVTLQGGNWSVSGPPHYAPSAVILSSNAIDVVAGSNAIVSDANISVGPNATGYGISLTADVDVASIVGNNVSLGHDAAGAISIGPSGGINCQRNLIIPNPNSVTSGLIVWPTTTSQPFTVANNPGFNPTGFYESLSPGGTTVTLVNQYGIPGTYYISSGTVRVEEVTVYDALTNAFHGTGLSGGAFHAEPGAQIRFQRSIGLGNPVVKFVAD